MYIKFLSPAKIELPEINDKVIRLLSYTNKSASYQLQQLKKNIRWKNYDPDAYNLKMKLLLEQKTQRLIFYENGKYWTYSGFVKLLNKKFGWKIKQKKLKEISELIPWNKKPFKMRSYQKEAFDSLNNIRHGAIELPTGSGKSLIIINLLKANPVKTLIISPSTNVTKQLYINMINAFGKKNVGLYADGKKEYKKLFTVANGQSITRIQSETNEWNILSKCKMFISDESHSIPAATFEKICLGIAEHAERRYFISATQTRTDGSELKLKGITGEIVYKKDFKELSAAGFLKTPIINILKVASTVHNVSDPKKEIRKNLYENKRVNQAIADIAYKMVNLLKRQVVIMVEEYSQFQQLEQYMDIPFKFVHGAISQDAKQYIDQKYWKVDSKQIFQDFNNEKINCIIGTTAMSVGVDLKPVGCIIYAQGGTSEIKLKQSIGRGTRPVKHKDLFVIDFDIYDSSILSNQLKKRKNIYRQLTDTIKESYYNV